MRELKKQKELDDDVGIYCSIFRQMEYVRPDFTAEAEIIAKGIYRGITFYVLSYGNHPCAYLDVGKTCLRRIGKIENPALQALNCHGGITYSENGLGRFVNRTKRHWVVGWDYNHGGDFDGRHPNYGGKKHRTGEIVQECLRVIDQIRLRKYRNLLSAALVGIGL